MKNLLALLVVAGLSISYALPFQEPIAGSYQCFASANPFDPNAQDASATLEIGANKSYTFSTATASETGSFTTYEMADSGSEDQEIAFAQAFQSGTIVALQPANTTLLYGGLFVMEDGESSYMLVKNNNGIWIRCQSAGADVAATMENIVAVGNETGETPDSIATTDTSTDDTATDTLTDNLVYNSLNSQINNMTSLGIPTLAPCYSCGY
jgi:hypothetical protein